MIRLARTELMLSTAIPLLLLGCGSTPPAPPRSDAYLIGADTPLGIRARRDILEVPSPEDKTRAQLLSLRILAGQLEDGSWARDATATGNALRDLYFLNAVAKDDPDLTRATRFLLDQEGAFVTYDSVSPVWGKDWIALYALNLWGFGDALKVRETVLSLLENQSLWLDRSHGRAGSAILRAITVHPLLADAARRDALVRKLAQWQGPGGTWDLGPGTSQLAVVSALLPLAPESRSAAGMIARFLPNVVRSSDGTPRLADDILAPDEAHFVIVRALDMAGKLDSYRRGDGGLAPYEIGLYTVMGAAEQSGHTLTFGDESVKIGGEPLLVGTEISNYRQILSPEQANGYLRLFLVPGAKSKVKDVLAADPAVEAALVLSGKILAKGLLAEMMDGDGLAIRGLAEEDAARLVQAVSRSEGAPIPATGAHEEKK